VGSRLIVSGRQWSPGYPYCEKKKARILEYSSD